MSDIAAVTEANRRNWDERVPVHRADRTGFYAIEAFRRGEDVLLPIEAAEIGDVAGRRLLHLQCHLGLDTLSLARRGAVATGVDFSAPAIAAARGLAAETGLTARFIECNIYDLRAALPECFDVVYSTWGAICWLHDIRRWAAVVAESLAPGGFLYLADGHPFAMMLDQEQERLVCRYPWRSAPDDPIGYEGATTYTGDDAVLTHATSYSWNHAFSDILGGLIDRGLRLDFLHEHEIAPWRVFPNLVPAGRRMFRLPEGAPRVPLAFSLRASKPG
jgi:SAM-dependent methyltransferase